MCVWNVDADAIQFGEKSLGIVYENIRIRDFLRNNRKLGIAGVKGQGKTFLLKVKRKLCQETGDDQLESDNNSPVICFPKNDMVDTVDSSLNIMGSADVNRTIESSLRLELNNISIWEQLWKISIAVCIIASPEFAHLYEKKDFAKLNNISKKLLDIPNEKVRPSVILINLLTMKYKDFISVIRDTAIFMQLIDRINCGIYFFIDKIEQAFSEEIRHVSSNDRTVYQNSTSYWLLSQYSLATAAYELFSSVNRHIKVFYSIRHEALIDSHALEPNRARNIESYICELVYTKEDIHEMFALYVANEDDENLAMPALKKSNPEKAFFGFDQIQHAYVLDTNENIFSYLYRHSLRRPYDVILTKKLFFLSFLLVVILGSSHSPFTMTGCLFHEMDAIPP